MRKIAIFLVLMAPASLPRLQAQSDSAVAQVTVPSTYTATKFDLYTAHCGLWRTDASYESTIRLKNQLAATPVDVTVTLYMADGTPFQLPLVHLAKSGVRTVNVNSALAAAPASVLAHGSLYGSASISYRYDWQGAVFGITSILDLSRSLEYQYPFVFDVSAATGEGTPQITTIEGPIRAYSQATQAFLSFANTTGREATVTLCARQCSERNHSPAICDSCSKHRPAPPDSKFGTVRITHDSTAEGLLVAGGLEDVPHGYSEHLLLAGIPEPTAPSVDNNFAAVGIMVGAQDPMMGFPSTLRFSAYAYFHNNGAQPIQLFTQAMYSANGQAQSVALPSLSIAPHQTQTLAIADAVKRLGLNGEVNLVFSYHGQAAALITGTGSIDQSGSYLFAVEPRAISGCSSKTGMYWRADNGFDTMYSLWNPKAEPEDLKMTFQYGEGKTYVYPVHLDANGMAMVDVKELMMKGQPDAEGHVLSSATIEGSLLVEGAGGHKTAMALVMGGGITIPGALLVSSKLLGSQL